MELTIYKTIEQLSIIRKAAEDTKKLILIQKDLDIAGEIQQAILPKIYPPFPDIKSLDIFGSMVPAKQVGGDFFDFFRIDNERIGFVIGDVSGKGIPAAIFMAVSRTLIRATGLRGSSSDSTINYVNKLLCNESVDSMFVTIFYGIINVVTGEIDYCNAGHNCPLLLKSGGEVINLPYPQNVVVGAFDFFEYKSDVYQMQPGDTLILYTDGVNEAFNINSEEFGEERLNNFAAVNANSELKDIVCNLIKEIADFAGEVEQSDDITVLTLRYR